ncbi:unnamed protein product [Aphanomyces euteiches]|nr:hypothetical protein AeRB84_019421 [Aphanomyces euteiches]
MELVHVLAVFRHGDRSPITNTVGPKLKMDDEDKQFWTQQLATETSRQYLNSITKIETDQGPPLPGGTYPNGHLTQRGVEDMTEKAREFRRRYATFLDGCNPHDQIYVCSTNIRRTLLSAQNVLSGLFPDDARVEKPLVIHALDPKLLTPHHTGAEMRRGLEALNEEAKSTLPGFASLDTTVKPLIGISPAGRVNWSALREVLDCKRAYKLPFPEGLTDDTYEAIVQHSAWEWYTLYSSPHLGQRGFVHGMRKIRALMEDAIASSPHRRLTLISAHDNSLVALVCALQLHHSSGFVAPPYGSMLVFDIYRDKADESHHLMIHWDGKKLRFPTQTTSLAPISMFDAVAKAFLAPHAPAQQPSSM